MNEDNREGRRELLLHLQAGFALDWHGLHGIHHWARVRRNGLAVGRASGADLDVVELFAFLHDSRRENEAFDPLHGERGARLARELHGRFFELGEGRLALLEEAIRDHSAGLVHSDATIQTCWDADRLDLGRVGIRPAPRFLSPVAAALLHEREKPAVPGRTY
jgi:uncharacterized protein